MYGLKKIRFFGIEIYIKQKELIEPKLFEIRAILRKKRPFKKLLIIFCSVIAILLIISVIIILCKTIDLSIKPASKFNSEGWAIGCDFSSNDLYRIKILRDLCKAACMATQNCSHYSWSIFDGGTCELKSGSVNETNILYTGDNSRMCGIINATNYSDPRINWNSQDWAFACNFADNDIYTTVIQRDLCKDLCERTPDCSHYSWNTKNGGTCSMKKGYVTKSNAFYSGDTTTICGVSNSSVPFLTDEDSQKVIEWQTGNWAYGCDFDGNSLSDVKLPSSLCANTCRQTGGCTHFTWTTYQSGTCWMKQNHVNKSNAFFTGNKLMICGIIDQSNPLVLPYIDPSKSKNKTDSRIKWVNGNWAFACNFIGRDLTNEQMLGEKCGGKCWSTTECTHFVHTIHNGGTCWLKYGTVSKSDAVYTGDFSTVCGIKI